MLCILGNYILHFISERIWFQMKLSTDFLWPLLIYLLIFLLRLNNFSNKIFLRFWASINDLTRTPSFHIAVSLSMPSFCPQPMDVAAVIPDRLSLVSFWLREAQRWWSWKLTCQLFLWLSSLFVERVEKLRVSQSPLEESRKRLSLGERNSSKLSALHGKIPHTENGRLYIVYNSFDVCVIR